MPAKKKSPPTETTCHLRLTVFDSTGDITSPEECTVAMQAALTDYIRARTALRTWGLSFTGDDSLTSILQTYRAQTQKNAGETEKLGKQVLKLQQALDLQRKQQQKSRDVWTQQSTALKEKVAKMEVFLETLQARETQTQDELRHLQSKEALCQQELQVWRDWHRVQHLRPNVCEVGIQAIRLKPREAV